MRTILIISMALFLAAAAPPTAPLNDRDFRQLMEAAVTAASRPSEVQRSTTTICVAAELEAPLKYSKEWSHEFQNAGEISPYVRTGNVGADRTLSAATASKEAAAHQTTMPALPPQFVVVSFNTREPRCVISRRASRGPNWKQEESVVLLTFTRPVVRDGYAFIEEYEDCAGLCGTTFLRVFRKQKGKWAQVTENILSVS